jgi:lambda repressor-like predicted transcriptional regulator
LASAHSSLHRAHIICSVKHNGHGVRSAIVRLP